MTDDAPLTGDLQTQPEHQLPALSVDPSTPMGMIALAVQSGASLEQVDKLINLKERLDKADADRAFNAAMAAFRKEDLTVVRTGKANMGEGKPNYTYAKLPDVMKVANPAMAKNGLTLRWDTKQDNGLLYVKAIVSHKLGGFASMELFSALDNSGAKNGVQAIGSTVTYLKRYTAEGVLGMSTEDDDDGHGAGNNASDEPVDERPEYTEEQMTKNYPKWLGAVQKTEVGNRAKHCETIIGKIETSYRLTDAHKKEIRGIPSEIETMTT